MKNKYSNLGASYEKFLYFCMIFLINLGFGKQSVVSIE